MLAGAGHVCLEVRLEAAYLTISWASHKSFPTPAYYLLTMSIPFSLPSSLYSLLSPLSSLLSPLSSFLLTSHHCFLPTTCCLLSSHHCFLSATCCLQAEDGLAGVAIIAQKEVADGVDVVRPSPIMARPYTPSTSEPHYGSPIHPSDALLTHTMHCSLLAYATQHAT